MKCKICLAKLKKGTSVCPECGNKLIETEEILEEAPAKPKKNRKGLKIGLAVTGLVLLAVVLTGAVLHFTGVINIKKLFSEQDIFYKASYTAANAKVERKGKTVIAKLGNQKLTNSELQIHYWTTVQDFVSYYGGSARYVKYITGMDPDVALDAQVYDETTGKTYQQWFLENSIESWRRYAVLAQLAENAGHQLTAEQQQALDTFPETVKQDALAAGYADVEAYVDYFYPGSSLEGYISYNAIILKAMSYYEVLYDSMMPTQAEMEAYYAQNEATFQKNKIAKEDGLYHNIRMIYIPMADEIGEIDGKPAHTQKEWDECLPKAQRVIADFEAEGGGEEFFAQLATEVSSHTETAQNGGLFTKLTKHTIIAEDPDEPFAEAFKEWYLAEERKPGDVGLVKDDNGSVHGYQILYYCSGTAIWEYETQTAVLAEKTDAMLQEAETKHPINIKYSKIVLGQVEKAETATNPT